MTTPKRLNISRSRFAVIVHDLFMTALAWWAARALRYALDPTLPMAFAHWEFPLVLALQGVLFLWTGLYRGLWRFISLPDLWNILSAAALGTVAIYLTFFLYNRMEGVPRSTLLLYPFLLSICLVIPRLIYRFWKDRWIGLFSGQSGQRVLILGVDSTGDMLLRDLHGDSRYRVVGFADEKPALRGTRINGHPVLGTYDQVPQIVQKADVQMLLIAQPNCSRKMRQMVQLCENTGLPYRMVPRPAYVVAGRAGFSDIREVMIEDILGRDAVEPDWEAIRKNLVGRRVLVTGGGGSIGAALCRQLGQLAVHSLSIVDSCEFNLYQIMRELRATYPNCIFNGVLADCGDEVAMRRLFDDSQPQIVFHAAAYKHVPLLQPQIRAAFRNNVLATRMIADLSHRNAVDYFILISTDKAVNPTSVMGACKRIAEIICQSLNAHSATRFITVRFGNVLDSAGSVVPLFREQIRLGGPVTVTHPEITRYFMSIPEASQLILQAAVLGQGGEIFALNMGESIRIRDLAEQMIRLSGKKNSSEIPIVYVGLRPGEKLFEELFHSQENYINTKYKQIFLARHRPSSWKKVQDQLARISQAVVEFDEETLRSCILEFFPSFSWNNESQTDDMVSIRKA